MAAINLRNYYPWYLSDEFVEVSEEVAAEFTADKRYENAYNRRVYYNRAHFSLDVEDGIERSAIFYPADDPQAVLEFKERFCLLCRALNSLPEIQGRRIEAHYITGKSQAEIADAEGVSKGAVSISITRGLTAMKKFMKNPDYRLNFCS